MHAPPQADQSTSTHLAHLPQLADHLDAADDARLQRTATVLVEQVHLIDQHQSNLQGWQVGCGDQGLLVVLWQCK